MILIRHLLATFGTSILAQSYTLQPGTWNFRGHPIAFETTSTPSTTSSINTVVDTEADAEEEELILLLNGFGVGSFHQHKLVKQLFELSGDTAAERKAPVRRVFCIDYLGQGKSWPIDCDDGRSVSEKNLIYSGETWAQQIIGFLEEVVIPAATTTTGQKKKVHLVGNSVGGHLAVFVAALRPDLVESLVLLNATPVWGLNLPGWDGRLPAPRIPKMIGRYLFDRIRDLNTIDKYLEAAYFNREAYDQTLMQQIRNCTLGTGGHAAFASILWSAPLRLPSSSSSTASEQPVRTDFYGALERVECDTLLLFGGDDPWCKPAFARRMLEHLQIRSSTHNEALSHAMPASRYVECSNVGHCPNHEAPISTAQILANWWSATTQRRTTMLFEGDQVREEWGSTVLQERSKPEEIPLSFMDRLAVAMV